MDYPDSINDAWVGVKRYRSYYPPLALFIVIVLYLLIFSSTVLHLYNNMFWFGAFDTGIFDQGTWLISQGKNPFVTVRGLHLFADHATYIQVLIAPLYWLWDSTKLLLIVQLLVLTLGAVPVYLIAFERFKCGWTSLLFSVSYLMYPALNYFVVEGYHPVTLSVTFILFSYYFLIRKIYPLFYVFGFLALMCKETLAPTFIFFGVYIFFVHDRKVGAVTYSFAIIWLLLLINVLMPFFGGGEGLYVGRSFGSFGSSPLEIIGSFLNPGLMYDKIVTSQNFKYSLDLLMPVSFLPLLDFKSLLIAASFFMNILTDWPYAHSIIYHYSAPIVPFIFISAINGVARFKNKTRYLLLALLLISAVAGNLYTGPKFTSLSNVDWITYTVTHSGVTYARSENIIEIFESIPDDASVSVSYNYLPWFAHREGIYMYPNPFEFSNYGLNESGPVPHPEVDYILLDSSLQDYLSKKHVIDRLVRENKYRLVMNKEKILVYTRSYISYR